MDTIDAILQAAYALFSERGFERTPVSDIAKKAGVAAGTVIYHFKTKENLLRVLNWFTLNRLYSDIRQRVQDASDGQDAIDRYMDEFFAALSKRSREITLLMETFSHSCGLKSAETLNMDINIQTIRSGLGDLLETLIREGCADGSIGAVDARQSGLGIMAMLIGSARLTLFHNIPVEELLASAKVYARSHLEPVKNRAGHDMCEKIG